MVFPPKFTLKSGSPLNINVEIEHARYVSAFLGQTLKLDWIDMSGPKWSEVDQSDCKPNCRPHMPLYSEPEDSYVAVVVGFIV